jgi:hypothetical protein
MMQDNLKSLADLDEADFREYGVEYTAVHSKAHNNTELKSCNGVGPPLLLP